MTRPHCCRRVKSVPKHTLFQPSGSDHEERDPIILKLDEFEAIRLADREGCYHEEAASRMDVSRATFGRILNAARAKVAEALVQGRTLRIEGGIVQTTGHRRFRCTACSHEWRMSFNKRRPDCCPQCQGEQIRKTNCNEDCQKARSGFCCNRP